MPRFVPDHLKTKAMCKNAVRKLPFVMRSVADQCNTKEMGEKVVIDNGGMLVCIPDC